MVVARMHTPQRAVPVDSSVGLTILLTELTRDLRTTGWPEVEVRRELGRELEARVGKACEMAEVLEHLF